MTFERRKVRTDKATELDRETWSDLDKITYEFLVKGGVSGVGEATAGPFWFGRAFDAPPMFSFSAVAQSSSTASQLTIGVEEWLQDEQGMYVGAMLWIVMNACIEPFPTGVVLDEGFEDIIKRQGGGPEGNEIICHGLFPAETINIDGQDLKGGNSRGWGWHSVQAAIYGSQDPFDPDTNVGTVGFKPIRLTSDWVTTDNPKEQEYRQLQFGPTAPWWVFNPECPSLSTYEGVERPDGVGGTATFYARTNWHVETANPSTGTHHIRTEQPAFNLAADDLLASSRPILQIGYLFPCNPPYLLYNWYDGVITEGTANQIPQPVWRIAQGNTVRFTFDAYLSKYDAQGSFNDTINVFLVAYSSEGEALGGSVDDIVFDPDPAPGGTYVIPFSLESAEGNYVRFSTGEIEVVHEDAYYFSVRMTWDAEARVEHGAYEAKFLDIDNLKLEIIGDQQPSAAPRFDVDLNFEGRILKNYDNIHPIEPFSHPTEVVLS